MRLPYARRALQQQIVSLGYPIALRQVAYLGRIDTGLHRKVKTFQCPLHWEMSGHNAHLDAMNASSFQLQAEDVHQELAMRHLGLIG